MQRWNKRGNRGQRHTPPYDEGQPATEAAMPNTQPPKHPFPPTGTGKGNFLPTPLKALKHNLIQARPMACLMVVIHNLATPYRPGNQPFATQMTNVNGQAPHEQSPSANIASNLEPQLGAQGAPSYPVGYQQPQASYPTSVSAVAPAANPSRYAASGGAALPPNGAATGFGCLPERAAIRALLCGASNV